MMYKALSFDAALKLYPEAVQVLAKERGVQTVTDLWILGDAEEWNNRLRLPVDEVLQLIKANHMVAEADDLPGLLVEFQKRLGLTAQVGTDLAWEDTTAWQKSWPHHLPKGGLLRAA